MSSISLGSQLDALAVLRVMESDRDEVAMKLEMLTEKAERYQQGLKTSLDEDLAGLKDELTSLESELNETLINQDRQFSQFKDQVLASVAKSNQDSAAKLEELNRRVQYALDRGFLLLWPRGSYALPTPASGCPSSAGVAWEIGSRKQHTESEDRNKDAVSEGNHLLAPVRSIDADQNNYVYQRFCLKTNTVVPGPTWPTGTYCISKRGPCPAFFQKGSITWDEHKSGGLSSRDGLLPNGQFFVSNTTLEYCCRADGQAVEPIDLPRSQPFYLYRHGGQCQQVAGMRVSEEFIRFDTQDVANADTATGQHPDVQLNNVVLQLCYYEQKEV
ncbi:apextrin [Elysia marginata]|uniref:Apextrin n=1 Tax=Elysia marginata TaxID=1093978 RepID=A0AAV4IY06_9GAST|nr:apextrin [Elysia marginata]